MPFSDEIKEKVNNKLTNIITIINRTNSFKVLNSIMDQYKNGDLDTLKTFDNVLEILNMDEKQVLRSIEDYYFDLSTLLVTAIRENEFDIVKRIIEFNFKFIDQPLDVEGNSAFSIALETIVNNSDYAIAEYFRYLMCNIEQKNNFNETPLVRASQRGWLQVCRYLIEDVGCKFDLSDWKLQWISENEITNPLQKAILATTKVIPDKNIENKLLICSDYLFDTIEYLLEKLISLNKITPEHA
jgi:hypothetical protein